MKKKHWAWIISGVTGLMVLGSLFVMGRVAYAVSTDSELGVVLQTALEAFTELLSWLYKVLELIVG